MMKRCVNIRELEIEAQILEERMNANLATLQSFAGPKGGNGSRDQIIQTRQEWSEIKAEQIIREYELEESRESGQVTGGSIERAVQRLEREAGV
jgi:hypothetical protein